MNLELLLHAFLMSISIWLSESVRISKKVYIYQANEKEKLLSTIEQTMVKKDRDLLIVMIIRTTLSAV